MSTQPDEIENEIEEGEVVTDDELSMTEEDQEIDFDEEDEEGLDIAGLMTSLMATPDGETVCSALVTIGQQLQTQNKILVKILSEMKTAKRKKYTIVKWSPLTSSIRNPTGMKHSLSCRNRKSNR